MERIRRVIEQLVEKGSVTDADGVERSIFPLDDYNLPDIRRAVSFFVTNLNWTVADIVDDRMVVLRTATDPDSRDFRFFAEF